MKVYERGNQMRQGLEFLIGLAYVMSLSPHRPDTIGKQYGQELV